MRKELREQIAAVQPNPLPAPAVAPRPTAPAIDPRDPEPTQEAFAAANPNHPDPYEGTILAKAEWRWRQNQRALAAAAHQQQREQAKDTAVATYQTRADELRGKHSDFDAVTQPFIDHYAQHPYSPAVAAFVASDPLGAQVLYHLAKHPQVAADVFAPGSNPLIALGEIRATVRGVLPTTKPQTSAPNPPSQTAGAGATATHDDPNTRSTRDHLRARAAEDADRRVKGLR